MDDDVFAIGSSRERFGVICAIELARENLAERRADRVQRREPLGLGDGGLEGCGSFLPTLRVFSSVGEAELGFRGFLR